jgi:hypothetical protein
MKIAFACQSCGKRYEVDSSKAGRRGRCAGCGQEMTVPPVPSPAPPAPGPAHAPMADGYALEEGGESTYTPAPGDEWDDPPPSPRPVHTAKSPDLVRSLKKVKRGQFARWRGPLIGLGVAVVVLAALALLVPKLAVVLGAILAMIGIVLVVGGYAVGAYVAFSEDFIFGALFLLVPIFTAWYFVSRFDEMKAPLAAVCLGLGLLVVAGWTLEYGHGPVLEDDDGANFTIESDPDAAPEIKVVPRPAAAKPGH